MAIFLSPGVYLREQDLSANAPQGIGALTPAFIGTAQKGPINDPQFVTNAQQAIDVFGNPFPESYLMYAVLAYFEEGARAWVSRVGVECEDDQPAELADICIDTSGAREHGWGRISLFSGIDYGKICTRVISDTNPLTFHSESIDNIDFNDVDDTGSEGPTTATLTFSCTSCSNDYRGVIDDSYLVLITGDADSSESVDGATYQIIRNSDGSTVAVGTLNDGTNSGTSDPVHCSDGLIFEVVVSSGALRENDSFTFEAHPNNLTFAFNVGFNTTDHVLSGSFTDGDSYNTAAAFVSAFNTLVGAGASVIAIDQGDGTACFRTDDRGANIQIIDMTPGTDIVGEVEAWALEIGQVLWKFDSPRAYLIGTDVGPYNITTANNRIAIDVVGSDTTSIEFSITTGAGLSATSVAHSVNTGGVYLGVRYFYSYPITMPGGDEYVIIETSDDAMESQLNMLANTSHIKTLRFADEVGIQYPYRSIPRTFADTRVVLPTPGTINPANPLSCEVDPLSDECAADSAYFEHIVGWLVAKSPGTWIDDYTVTLEPYTDAQGLGDTAGLFRLRIFDSAGVEADAVDNITFDPTAERYIGNVINEGSSIGGTNGNSFVQWEARPSFLNNDPIGDPSNFEIRVPGPFNNDAFTGAANGIPEDAVYSSEIDRALIGNPAEETGVFAYQNPEVFDINLLVIPGASSGSVIAQGLSMCEGRGDVLYIVDPPFGLRPQQVVDWSNGMLFSDLSTAINSSYGALYFPHLKIFDQFNNTEIWVPPSGHVAAVYARTDKVAEQWFAPAGLNRGHILTALDTEVDLTQGERDLLYGYNNAVNPIVNFPQDGITVWGQRTLQRADTALDRVNVRMLVNYIKKNSQVLLRGYLFEPNDVPTRARVKVSLDGFLGDVAIKRGITAWNVVCDERNNTSERQDRNELWVAIFIKPTRAIEYIVVNLVIMRTDQSFAAEEVLAAAGVTTTT